MKKNALVAIGLALLLSPALGHATTIGVTIDINPVTELEGNSGTTDFDFEVTLTAALSEAITIYFETLDNSATTANNDYQPLSSSIVINSGLTSGIITILVNGDTTVEPDEIFGVRLTGFDYSAIDATVAIGNQRARGTILNDDSVAVPAPGPLVLLAAGLLGLLTRRRRRV